MAEPIDPNDHMSDETTFTVNVYEVPAARLREYGWVEAFRTLDPDDIDLPPDFPTGPARVTVTSGDGTAATSDHLEGGTG